MGKTITLTIDEETETILNKQPNKSEFVRVAVLEKAGNRQQPLEELEKEIEYLKKTLNNKEERLNEYYNTIIQEKEERTKEEREAIELKARQKATEDDLFIKKWYPIISNYPDIMAYSGELTFNALLPFIEQLKGDKQPIGFQELKRFLILKQ